MVQYVVGRECFFVICTVQSSLLHLPLSDYSWFWTQPLGYISNQCCVSGMFIPDPRSIFFSIPGSNNNIKLNFYFWTGTKKNLSFLRKNLRIFFLQKNGYKTLRNVDAGCEMRDPGFEIRDPEKTCPGSRIRTQRSKKHRIPDTGSGSTTLSPLECYRSAFKRRLSLYVCIRKRCSFGLARAWPQTSRSKLDLVTWWRLHSGIRRTVKKPSNFLDVPSINTFLMWN